jgi:hypothetical protein
MSSPGNNPPHAPRDDPSTSRRHDLQDAKAEAKAERAEGNSPLPWYKRLLGHRP